MTSQQVWSMAICDECLHMRMPFNDTLARAFWITAHEEKTGHRVRVETQKIIYNPEIKANRMMIL